MNTTPTTSTPTITTTGRFRLHCRPLRPGDGDLVPTGVLLGGFKVERVRSMGDSVSILTLRALPGREAPIHTRLRRVLKSLCRAYGLRVSRVETVPQATHGTATPREGIA